MAKSRVMMSAQALSSSILFFFLVVVLESAQAQDPMTMYGGSVLAMAGKDCVALAVDKRFGVGNSLIHITPRPVLQLPDDNAVMVAFTGLEGDVQSLRGELSTQVAAKYSRGLGFGQSSSSAARKTISATAMASLTSHVLYQKRSQGGYFVEPLVVGLEPNGWIEEEDDEDDNDNDDDSGNQRHRRLRLCYRPYLCSMDTIGAKSESKSFVCAGAASKSLFGTAEALWEPDLSAEELLAVCSKAFLSALERDCLSGYGAVIYMLTPDEGIVEYDLAGRSD